MKRALLVGIDKYDARGSLHGCVNDVRALYPLLARNEDDFPNFHCQVRDSERGRVDRHDLLAGLDELLAPGADVALFYFAGHGEEAPNDVVLGCQNGQKGDLGIPLSEVLAKVQRSKVSEILILLDCCFSGHFVMSSPKITLPSQ